jgi:hypothetical protein
VVINIKINRKKYIGILNTVADSNSTHTHTHTHTHVYIIDIVDIEIYVTSYVLLTVHLGVIFVNNQLDAHFFFVYIYFYSLHVLGSHVPITRKIHCINTSGICHSV